jgi:HK97 family phage prohead protease
MLFCRKFLAKMAKQERKLPERLEHEFIICDNSINRYNWRLLVEGIDLVGFLKNPVCCLQHDTNAIPVGRWINVRVDGEALKGTVEFDRNDEDAVKLYWKYKDGYMSAVSLNIIPIEESDDKALLLTGQKFPTITKSELLEVSLVTIPAQKNAVKLSTPEGHEYKLSLLTINNSTEMNKNEEKTVEQLTAELAVQKQLNADNLIRLHQQRGVISDGEVESLKKLALIDLAEVSKMLDARQTPKPAESSTGTAETLADALVALHFGRGAITEQEKSVFRAAATLDYDATKKVLEAKPGTEQAKTFVQGLSGAQASATGDGRANWNYLQWYKNDWQALSQMEKNEPDKYKKLVADFEAECTAAGITA